MKFTRHECSDDGFALLQWYDGRGRKTPQSVRMPAEAVQRILALQAAEERAKPSAADLFGRDEQATTDRGPSLRFVIATPPSSKNNRHVQAYTDRATGKPRAFMYRDSSVKQATEGIREAVALALMRQAPAAFRERRPLWENDDVRVEVVHNVVNETCDITMFGAGAPPRGRTGRRRDVTNLPELILDACQRVAYTNDNQVSDLRVYRNVATPTTELL